MEKMYNLRKNECIKLIESITRNEIRLLMIEHDIDLNHRTIRKDFIKLIRNDVFGYYQLMQMTDKFNDPERYRRRQSNECFSFEDCNYIKYCMADD